MVASGRQNSSNATSLCESAIVPEARHVADRRVHPDVEVLVGGSRNQEAEVRRVAADVPGLESGVEPLSQLVGDFGLQRAAEHPLLQHVGELRQIEEVVLGAGEHRRCAGDQRARILQIGRVVSGAAHLAVVAVLVVAAAARTFALHEPVGQEQFAFRVEQLLHVAREDVAAFEQSRVDAFAQPAILFGVRRIEVVVRDEEAFEIALVLDADPLDQLFGGTPSCSAFNIVAVPCVSSAQT